MLIVFATVFSAIERSEEDDHDYRLFLHLFCHLKNMDSRREDNHEDQETKVRVMDFFILRDPGDDHLLIMMENEQSSTAVIVMGVAPFILHNFCGDHLLNMMSFLERSRCH